MRIAAQKFVTIPLIVVLTLIAAIAASGGEYCKWTDESGVVHFDEKCPDNVTSAIVATESERTESQIRAAEEHSKSLLSEPTQSIKSTRKSQRSESGIHAGVTADSSPQVSKDSSQMSAEQLDVMCEEEREKRLAPEREPADDGDRVPELGKITGVLRTLPLGLRRCTSNNRHGSSAACIVLGPPGMRCCLGGKKEKKIGPVTSHQSATYHSVGVLQCNDPN